MKQIIATWICLDDAATGTYFPSAMGSSSDRSVQDKYWRCIACFFTTARYFNPQAELVLFCNRDVRPVVDGVDLFALLERLGVRTYTTPFTYITPEGYYKTWRNQFYEFSILEFISDHPQFSTEDGFLLLDSDCIINGDLRPLFQELQAEQCLTYNIDYAAGHDINGISRIGMKAVYEDLLEQKLDEAPAYHGGEFYASTIGVARQLVGEFRPLWPELLARHAAGLPKLNEEAHVLSYLFYRCGWTGGQANRYIKRLWTDPASYRNVEAADKELLIWHLPTEKRYGFRKLFGWLQQQQFDLSAVSPAVLHRYLQRTFNVPSIPLERQPYYAAKSLLKKMLAR